MIKTENKPPFSWATSPKQIGQENEDAHLWVKGNGGMACAVFDGIGGAPGGEKASTQAAKFCFYSLNMTDYHLSPEEIARRLRSFLQGADRHLKRLAASDRLTKEAG